MKYSPWFKCKYHKPSHVGKYQWRMNPKHKDQHNLDYWDGEVWRTELSRGIYDPIEQNRGYWRGILK